MDQQSHVIPFDLEAPVPVMFWDPLEFSLAVMCMGFGIIAKLWLIGMVAGAAVLVGSRYLKRGAKRGAMQHLLWALGLEMDPHLKRRFPPSWVNDFVQ
jgi:type IV conjugative transfer system protein TraL